MANNTTNTKNNQDALREELEKTRNKWQEKNSCLVEEIKNLGYNDSIDEFLKYEPDFADYAHASAILALQEKIKEHLEQKKQLWPEEAAVDELNKKHAIVHSDQTYVLTEKIHPLFGGIDFSLESTQSLRTYYEDEVVTMPNGKPRSKADIWLKSSKRRKYNGIIFDPTHIGPIKDQYNIWRGFTKQPHKGDCSLYWEHIKNNICGKDEQAYLFVRKWLAHVFQQPDQVHTALVICGSQGVGKNSFVEPLGILLGSHYVALSNISELISNFNFHLKNAVLIHANEAFWGGNRKDIGTLKAMITDKSCLIEGKGKDRIMVINYKHVIISSNEDWPVHLDPDDRRFYVLHVSEDHKEDTVYFGAIQEQLDDGGYEALLYDLLHEDLLDFNPRKLPKSPYAFELKMRGTNSTQKFIYDMLQGTKLSDTQETLIPKDELFVDYKIWCENSSEKCMCKNEFCKEVKKLLPSTKKDTRKRNGSERIRNFEFPLLKQSRIEFCNSFKEEYENIFCDDEDQDEYICGPF